MNYYLRCFAMLNLTVSAALNAAWYEATGQAVINSGDIATARQHAIDDAVKRAALAAGARISSTQQIVNGVLLNEQTAVSSSGEIKQFRLLSEQQSGDMLTLTVQLDIEPQLSQCSTNHYRKSLLFPTPHLLARQDAVYGQLFDFGQDIAVQLERHFRDYSPAALVSSLPYSIENSQLQYPQTEQLFVNGQQFVLQSRITDLSLGQSTNSFWQTAQKQRFFALDVSLFDVFEQRVIYQQEYRTNASWPYKQQTPSSHSQAFRQLPYGTKIDQLLHAVADDIQQQLKCQPLLSSITQVKDNQLQLSLGKMHGLKAGDRLTLLQIQRHPATPNVKRVIQHPASFTVTDLTEQNAWAKPMQQQLIGYIQQGDVVSVHHSKH